MKTILFLGGAPHQMPAIETARQLGIFTIVADNQPSNPGHRLADMSYPDVSTLDKERILELAKENSIHGIISFASDVSMPTQQYVSRTLGFPCHPAECVSILTDKHKFRYFMEERGFLRDFFFTQFSQRHQLEVTAFLNDKKPPFVIKPVDSSGSKGVSILRTKSNEEIRTSVDSALSFSPSRTIIVEKFVQQYGSQICGDGYFEDGKIVFVHYGDGKFYNGIHAPYGEIFPSSHSPETLTKVTAHLQDVLVALKFWRGPFNLDVIIDDRGEPFIIELGARSGGNFIPEATKLHTGVDCTESLIRTTLNPRHRLNLSGLSQRHPVVACYMIHQFQRSVYRQIYISPQIQMNLLQVNPYLSPGAELDSFTNASNVAGNTILKFDSLDETQKIWQRLPELIQVEGESI